MIEHTGYGPEFLIKKGCFRNKYLIKENYIYIKLKQLEDIHIRVEELKKAIMFEDLATDLSILITKRNFPCILKSGYIFTIKHKLKTKISFVCSKSIPDTCPATLEIIVDSKNKQSICRESGMHTHSEHTESEIYENYVNFFPIYFYKTSSMFL